MTSVNPIPYASVDPANPPAAWLPLAGLGVIRASGPEARAFLQSQLTNDAKLLSPTQGQLSGYCSPKGRLLAVFTLLELGPDDFALTLPLALLAPTLKRLKMFVLRSRLTLVDASVELPAAGVIGEAAEAALQAQGLPVPSTDYGCAQHDGIWLLRRPGPVSRFELRAAPTRLLALQAALKLPAARAEDWALAEVLAATPQVLSETADHFVPQSIDLDSAGGVSFTKGCYPGQEIVARVHYLGRIKQRLRLATSNSALAPGTSLLNSAGQSVGAVMAASPHPTLGALALVSLNLSHAGGEPLQAGESGLVAIPVTAGEG